MRYIYLLILFMGIGIIDAFGVGAPIASQESKEEDLPLPEDVSNYTKVKELLYDIFSSQNEENKYKPKKIS